jgi:rhomboid protease GluP
VVHVATAFVAPPRVPLWRALLLSRSVEHRVAAGGNYAPLIGEDPWRLCTCVLLHADALHLAMNGLALLALGRVLEPLLGPARLLSWFAAGGVAGSLASHLAGVRQSDGASGGAFALLAAAVVGAWRWRDRLSEDDRWLMGPVLGAFLVVNLVLGCVIPSIDPVAHVGGLLLGLALPFLPDHRLVRALEAIWLGGFAGMCAYGWMLG